MKNIQNSSLLILASLVGLIGCSSVPNDNVLDPASKNYVGDSAAADSNGNGIANYYESSKVASSSVSSSTSSQVANTSSSISSSSSSAVSSSSVIANPSAEYIADSSASLWVGKTEVAQWLYASVMKNDSLKAAYRASGDSLLPISNISWREAIKFCNALSHDDSLGEVYSFKSADSSVNIDSKANGYRLPSVAEWETIASSGDTANVYVWGSQYNLQNANKYAWNDSNASFKLHDVASRTASTGGFYDLMGNVTEMTQDTSAGGYVKLKGGSYATDPTNLMISTTNKQLVTAKAADVGFRIVRKISP